MSAGHVSDRLSPYLDQELTEAEAALVRQHLGECEACALHLRELRRADRAFAADLPEPPEAYFESFAARVRQRIEAAPSGASSGRFRLPVWSWALAAALLLGVLLPRLPWDLGPAPKAAPEPRADRAEEGRAAAKTASADTFAQAERRPSEAAPAPTPAPPQAPPPAAARPNRDAMAAPPPASAPVPTLPAAEDRRRQEETDREAQALLSAEAAPRPADTDRIAEAIELKKSAAGPSPEAKEETAQAPPAAAPAEVVTSTSGTRGAAAAPSLRRPEAAKRRPGFAEPGREAAAAGLAGGKDDAAGAAEYQALRERKARSLDEWRALRGAWQSFLVRHPEGPSADEARVRVVEASGEVWARTGDEGDRAEARRLALGYLGREDAVQADRVRVVLRRIEP